MAKGNPVASTIVILLYGAIFGFVVEHFLTAAETIFGNIFLASAVIALPLAYIADYFAVGSWGAKDFKTFAIVYLIVFIFVLLAAWGIVQFTGLEEMIP